VNKYKIAHIREQGQDIIIVPLDRSFEQKPNSTQQEIISALQVCASTAGLAGTVVPVWQVGSNHKFIAPRQWQSYFKSISWNFIMSNLNKELSCG